MVFFFFFLTAPHSLWEFSSLIGDRSWLLVVRAQSPTPWTARGVPTVYSYNTELQSFLRRECKSIRTNYTYYLYLMTEIVVTLCFVSHRAIGCFSALVSLGLLAAFSPCMWQ